MLGSISSYKIYEDDEFLAVLDINPANLGHVIIISKIHVKNIYEVNSKIFDLANLIAKKMKEKLDADSNIFVANGENAGQKVEHVIVHIIPRYKDDNINLTWQTRKVSQDKLNEILLILKIQEEKKETKKEKIIVKVDKKRERMP